MNEAGGVAFAKPAQLKLVSLLFTSFVEDQFYRSKTQTLNELKTAIAGVDLKFAAKAAIYARVEFGMRSITHAAAAVIAYSARGKGLKWIKEFINKVVYRVDDAAEILAAYLSLYGKPIPNGLKKGLARSLSKFDAYQLAKYRGDKDSVKLVDLFNLVHPKPSEKQAEAFKALIAGELASDATWESKLSAAGQGKETAKDKEAAKNAAWKEMLSTGKMPYFALLRNLRNILQTESEELVKLACTQLTNKKAIEKSLVLPFRFITAAKQISMLGRTDKLSRNILSAIDRAVSMSLENVPELTGETLIAVDVSGSMTCRKLSGRSEETACDIACLFGAVLAKKNNSDLLLFDNYARYHASNLNDSVLTITESLRRLCTGGGTSFAEVFKKANKKYDNIIMLTDEQAWQGNTQTAFKQYCQTHKVFPNLFMFDLAGYGTMQLPAEGVFSLAGFSDKTMSLIAMLSTDKNSLVNLVETVELE